LAAPHEEALQVVEGQDRANADETGWREDKKKAWLWVAVTELVTVFLVHTSRGAIAAKALLGESFKGILTTDRWGAYNWISTKCRQLYWSHLQRDFKSFLDYGLEAKELGERLLGQTRRMFRLWYRVRDGTLSRKEFQLLMKPVRGKILALLEEGTGLSSRQVKGKCKKILKLQDALFTFVDVQYQSYTHPDSVVYLLLHC
jgi:transposase